MQSLKNKTVLITGASSGIGKACAKGFAALGVNIILVSRRLSILVALAAELREAYQVNVLPLSVDLKDKAAVFAAIQTLPVEFAPVDILVNNAGVALGYDNFQDGDCDEWDVVIDTNVKGLLYMTRACLPGMLKQQSGHIINVGSMTGTESICPGAAVYSASKHAVHQLSKSMRLDMHKLNIRVTEVDPGAVETSFMATRHRGDAALAQSLYDNMTCLNTEDIADAVIYAATRRPEVNIEQMIVCHVGQAAVSLNTKYS